MNTSRNASEEQRQLHEDIVSLRHRGLGVIDIGKRVFREHSTVSYHLNNNCRCLGPSGAARHSTYVYVPASWFRCRLCGGGWFERNGCRHSWELTI